MAPMLTEVRPLACVFRSFRQAISLESGRRFRCKAAPSCEGCSVPASTHRPASLRALRAHAQGAAQWLARRRALPLQRRHINHAAPTKCISFGNMRVDAAVSAEVLRAISAAGARRRVPGDR